MARGDASDAADRQRAALMLYYAYNPLRLFKDIPQQLALPNTCSPGQTWAFQEPPSRPRGAGPVQLSQQALQVYGTELPVPRAKKDTSG